MDPADQVTALQDENAMLKNALRRSEVMIMRLLEQLNVSAGGAEQTLQRRWKRPTVVKNTAGEVLFPIFLDPPKDLSELQSWFVPYLSPSSLAPHSLIVAEARSWMRLEDSRVSFDELPEVILVADFTAAQCHSSEYPAVCSLLTTSELQVQGLQRLSVHQVLLNVDVVLLTIVSFLRPVEVRTVACLSSPLRQLISRSPDAASVARLMSFPSSSRLALSGVFVVRPLIHVSTYSPGELNYPRLARTELGLHRLNESFSLSPVCLPPWEWYAASMRSAVWSNKIQSEMLTPYFAAANEGRRRGLRELRDPSQITMSYLQPGDQLDALDHVHKWYDATVLHVDEAKRCITIHYNKWSNKFDEVIFLPEKVGGGDLHHPRLQPLGTKFDVSADKLRSDLRFFVVYDTTADVATDAARNKDVCDMLDARWSFLVTSVFSTHESLPTHLEGCRPIVRAVLPQDIMLMIESSMIDPKALQRFLSEKEGRVICRIVEMYKEGALNAFFVAWNARTGFGLMYVRYGASQWKH